MDISENSALFVYPEARRSGERSRQAPEADGPETRVCGIL